MKKVIERPGGAEKPAATLPAAAAAAAALTDQATLPGDLRSLVQSARQRLAAVANATYTHLCWQVGRRLLRENLYAGRAAYGKQILATVSQEWTAEFGAGFNYTALTRMARFAEWMTDEQILATLSETLSWSHFIELLQLDAQSIRVSEYLTELPPLPLLRERLHQAIEHVRESAARRVMDEGQP